MENATKALIIAASILIAIMVISIGLYLFASMSAYTSSAEQKISTDQIMQFNNNFLKYDGRENLTAHDIVTIANYAKKCNEENGFYDEDGKTHNESQYYVSVAYIPPGNSTQIYLEGNKINNMNATDYFNKLLKGDYTENSELNTYTCKVYVSSVTSRVYKVEFTMNRK